MLNKLKSIPKEKYWGYFILISRVLLAWTFLSYGTSKLFDEQFGLNESELATPIKDLSLFKISWYLFDQQPFKAFIGISQVICGLLLLFNRTVIIGAFMFLPIVVNILVIDLSYMPAVLKQGFAQRLIFYIILDLLILWHYKGRVKTIWIAAQSGLKGKSKFPIWSYLLLPVFAIILEMLGATPKILFYLITKPNVVIESIKRSIENFNF